MSASDLVVEYVRPHGLRRMLGRDPLEPHREVTPLVVVGYETAGYRHVEADVRRES